MQTDALKPFNLNLGFDGNTLSVDYCDGSDVESYPITSKKELVTLVSDLTETALSPEDA